MAKRPTDKKGKIEAKAEARRRRPAVELGVVVGAR